jgi:hypothetical protein
MPDRTVHLTSFTDSIPHTNIRWERIAMYSPAIVAGTDKTTGSINTRDFVNSNTYTYKYISTSQCGSTEARVYIRTVKDRIFRTADTVKICRDNESNKTLNLNHILGVEFGGDWKYDATVNPDATVVPNVTMKSSTSQYAGARIFDAVNAYNTAPASYSYVYNGHTNAKIFKFEYHPSNGSNIVAKKKLVIVVTL